MKISLCEIAGKFRSTGCDNYLYDNRPSLSKQEYVFQAGEK